MINKFIGDQFKIAFSVTHTSGRKVSKSLATIKGPNSFEYKAECCVNDGKDIELLVTREMYKSPGMYNVTFDNCFDNGESATHFIQFSMIKHSGYEVSSEVISDVAKSDVKGGDIGMKNERANFILTAELITELAEAGIPDEYRNPLLTWIKLVFTDDQPNANRQGIAQDEFPSLIKSMAYMPVKAKFEEEVAGLQGHSGAVQIGVLKGGQQEGNKVIAIGALYNDEFPEVVDFFKNEISNDKSIEFSWEIRYKDSELVDDVEWLKGTTTRAVTAVKTPAYEGRTPLISISSFDMIKMIDDELRKRGELVKA